MGAVTPETSGEAFLTTVTAKDSFDNTVTTDNSTVVTVTATGSAQFDSNDNGTFGDNTKALVAGTFTISTRDNVAENITITATSAGGKTGNSPGITVEPGVIDHYVVSAGTSQTAGAQFNVTVTAKDTNNNTVTYSSRVVTLTSSGGAQFDSDGNGTFDDNTKALSSGTLTMSTRDTAAQSITITVTDADAKTGVSSSIMINPGAIDHYSVGATTPQQVGTSFLTMVTAKDSFNNTVTADSSTVVTMTGAGSVQFDSDGNGTFGDNTKALANGQFTINTKDNVAESVTLTATSAGGKTGSSSLIVVETGVTWNAGGTYTFLIRSATGVAGTDWDQLRVTGNLGVLATITNAFTVRVVSLSGSNPGLAANFDNNLAYAWPFATVSGSITNFDATKFVVDSSGFQNSTGSGRFSVGLSPDQKSLNLIFTPSCGMGLTTSTYAIGSDGKVHMYFSNPFGFTTAGGLEARMLNNCTVTLATAYGSGFESGQFLGGLPLTVVGQSTSIPAGATRLEVVATKVNSGQSATVNVLVRDACGSQGNFDPVFTELKVQQGGVVRQSFSNVPAAEHYMGVLNGTPGWAWLCIVVNGQVFALNPLTDVLLDVGVAMGEGNTNVVVLAGQGVAGASASITIGDLSVVTGTLTPVAVVTGTAAQHWSGLALAGENPLLQIAFSAGNIVLSWADLWDGFEVQTCTDFAPQMNWVPLEVSPWLSNGLFTVPVPASSGALFRLYKP